MRGSLIVDRINDPHLQKRWRQTLIDLKSALDHLDRLMEQDNPNALGEQYLDAVLQYSEARDDERNFFWDTFVEQRRDAPRTK